MNIQKLFINEKKKENKETKNICIDYKENLRKNMIYIIYDFFREKIASMKNVFMIAKI